MTSIVTRSLVEGTLDRLGQNIESQMRLMQDSTDATLTETFNAVVKKGSDGLDMTDILSQWLAVDLSGATRPYEELERILAKAEELNYNPGSLKTVLPMVKAISDEVHAQQMPPAATIVFVREYMNKNYPKP